VRRFSSFLVLVLALGLANVASAGLLTVGYISYDVTLPGSTAEFDIVNLTGPNSTPFPDPTAPIVTPVNLSSLSLTVDFSDGSTVVYGSSYFTLAPDGLSFDGSVIPIGGANPQPTDATLTGTFSTTTVTLNDGSIQTISPTFSATILPSSPPNLADGDLGIISATTTTVSGVPEPGAVILLATAIALLFLGRRMNLRGMLRKLMATVSHAAIRAALILAVALLAPAANASVTLTTWTAPSTGVAGVDFVNLTGSGFPGGQGTFPPANATVTFALSCGGAVVGSGTPTSIIAVIGTEYRVHVELPGALGNNNYFASLSGTTSNGTHYASSNCSEVTVTHTSTVLGSCVPASSLGVIAPVTGPAQVKAIVPNGSWCCSYGTGIEVVQLETGGGPTFTPVTIPTSGDVNSCAGNPATGEAVCVDNNTGVYHISSTNTVTTLTSSANNRAGFSGGSCENCGVAVNALTNQAVITEGYSPSPSNSALQALNLSTNTFGTPFPLFQEVSENISIDPTRGYVLSANEDSYYNLIGFNSTGAFTNEFNMYVNNPALTLDSSTEDCATGIALAPGEFSNYFVLSDLTQATFTPGTPGTWTAPTSETAIIGSYSAGLSGSAVAPGSSHLAVVTGEFGGSSFAILKLPSTSGTGTPALVDYAYVPCVNGMTAGYDPHTVTAYVSPNDGNSYAVFANWSFNPPNLLVANMAGILALPRGTDGHTVNGETGTGSCLDPAGTVGSTVLRNVAN
jgi:hypothetical protein